VISRQTRACLLMLGALGGVTVAAMVLQARGVRPAVIGMWVLFAVLAGVHVYVL